MAGPGTDIGYVNSRHKDKSDPRNKLVYVTDGTLVNMIRRGELHDVSVVVIDEAHERSLNIDLILVATAPRTARTAALEGADRLGHHRDQHLHRVLRAGIPRPGVPDAQQGHSRGVRERWVGRSGAAHRILAPPRMPARAASTVVELLRWMATGDRPADIPADVECHQGDILVFLTGRGGITTAIKETTQLLIGAEPEMGRVAGR
ncbi:hypothetical protein ACRAWF_25735 [Streptomyces sp. L7]